MMQFADDIFAIAKLVAGRTGSEWISAIMVEADVVTSDAERFQWALGALCTAIRIRGSELAGSTTLQAVAVTLAILVIEWRSGLAQLVVPALALTTAALAFQSPDRIRTAMLIPSGGLVGAHLAADLIPPLRPWYQYQALDMLEWSLVLTAFLSCAAVAAIIGARLRLLFERNRNA